MRSRKLQRQYVRGLGREDAEDYIARISAALRHLPPDAVPDEYSAFLDKFPAFAAAVDESYAEYEDKLRIASYTSDAGSTSLSVTRAELDGLRTNINALLDSLPQGLLFFGPDGVCAPLFSRACIDLLQVNPADRPLWEVLRLPEDGEDHVRKWLNFVFAGDSALDFDDLKYLAPAETVNDRDRIIELDYRPMKGADSQLHSVLMIATDCTDKRAYTQKIRDTQDEAAMVLQIAQNRNGYYRFVNNLKQFVKTTMESGAAFYPDVTMRELHTLKGLAASFSLRALAQTLDDLETTLRMVREDEAMRLHFVTKEIPLLDNFIAELTAHGRALFGDDFIDQGQVRTVEVGVIYDLAGEIDQLVTDADLRDRLLAQITKNFLTVPLASLLNPFRIELARIAEQQGKPAPAFEIHGDNVPVIAADYSDFIDSLVHIARNIMDHGIETPDERSQKGKDARGRVDLALHKTSEDGQPVIIMAIHDDGRGIDPTAIRNRLSARGYDAGQENDAQVIQHIFDADFTTRNSATNLSGRGVGMGAVRDIVESTLGGAVRVESRHAVTDEGTSFVFAIPYKI